MPSCRHYSLTIRDPERGRTDMKKDTPAIVVRALMGMVIGLIPCGLAGVLVMAVR